VAKFGAGEVVARTDHRESLERMRDGRADYRPGARGLAESVRAETLSSALLEHWTEACGRRVRGG
jgi:hypothetical protein